MCIPLLNTCQYCGNAYEYWANTWKMCLLTSVILAIIVTIFISFEAILKRFSVRINFKVNFKVMVYHKLKNKSKLLQNLQVLWQYSRMLHLQVNAFFKYWLNTCEYWKCRWTHFSSIATILNKYFHNTCKYWAGEYTLILTKILNFSNIFSK